MSQKFSGIKGMNDVLPATSYQWLWLEEKLKSWLTRYGYRNIRTPVVEETSLFVRSIGAVTDIVEKEMYSFVDKLNGDCLTLRPEGTAGTLRAVIEHSLLYNNTQKLWYMGPMFRHEKPQKGRYRQFHQLGIELLGFKGPDADIEIILMLNDLWQQLGLKNIELHINCLGNQHERQAHRQALIDYWLANQDLLDEEARRRLHSNPLRILDTKNPDLQDLVIKAPRLIDYLQAESLSHYANWRAGLTALGIEFIENPRLVRGLDYYNLSVFEWLSNDLGAQATVCGGGRYDPLIAELGAKDNYAIGCGLGLERLLLLLESKALLPSEPSLDVFIINEGNGASELAFRLASSLRANGYSVIQNLGGGSFKSQFKKAASLGAKLGVVVGENEVKQQQVVLKCMATQQQQAVALDAFMNAVNNYFN